MFIKFEVHSLTTDNVYSKSDKKMFRHKSLKTKKILSDLPKVTHRHQQ